MVKVAIGFSDIIEVDNIKLVTSDDEKTFSAVSYTKDKTMITIITSDSKEEVVEVVNEINELINMGGSEELYIPLTKSRERSVWVDSSLFD